VGHQPLAARPGRGCLADVGRWSGNGTGPCPCGRRLQPDPAHHCCSPRQDPGCVGAGRPCCCSVGRVAPCDRPCVGCLCGVHRCWGVRPAVGSAPFGSWTSAPSATPPCCPGRMPS
jgi:hypothetical protein